MAGRAGGASEAARDYQASFSLIQQQEKQSGAVGEKPSFWLGIAAFFKSASLIKGLSDEQSSAADKGHNIRQLARFQDTLDYSKLEPTQVRNLMGKISTPEQLAHFCLRYNPTQLQKANIISEGECKTLKTLFDKSCKEMPGLLNNMQTAVTSGKSIQDVEVKQLYDNTVGKGINAPSDEGYNVLSRGIGDEIDRITNKKAAGEFSQSDAPSIKDLDQARLNGTAPILKKGDVDTSSLPKDKRSFHDVVLSCMGDTERKCTPLQNAMATQKSVHSSFSGVGAQKPATLVDWVNLYNGDNNLKSGSLKTGFIAEIGELDLQNPQSIESFKTFCKLTGRPEPTLPQDKPFQPSKEDIAAAKAAKSEETKAVQPDKGAIDQKIGRFDQRVGELQSVKEMQKTTKTQSPKTEPISVEQWKGLLNSDKPINSATLAGKGKIDKPAWENLDKALNEEVKDLDTQCTTLRESFTEKEAPVSHLEATKTSDALFNLNNKISGSGLVKNPIKLSFIMEERKRK